MDNTIQFSVNAALAQNTHPYASYIAIMSGEHRLDKRAELVSYNANAALGELFATFKTAVSESEFPYQADSVGFCGEEGGELFCKCDIEPARPSTVYGTVRLSLTADAPPIASDNPLVKSLLGMTELGTLSVKAKREPLAPYIGSASGEYTSVPSTVRDGEIEFNTDTYMDFLVCCDGEPTLRYSYAYANPHGETVPATAKNGSFFVDGALGISSVTSQQGEAEFAAYPIFDRILPGKEMPGIYPSYKLISDPQHKYLGLSNDAEHYVMGDDLKLVHKGSTFGTLTVCSDGTAVTHRIGRLEFLDLNKTVSIGGGTVYVMSRAGGYDIFVCNAQTVTCSRFDGTEISETYSISVDTTENLTPCRLNAFTIALVGKTSAYLFTAEGRAGTVELGAPKVSDGILFGDGKITRISTGATSTCDEAFGEFFTRNGELFYLGKEEVSLGSVEFDSIASVGNAIALLSDGKLKCYRAGSCGTAVDVKSDGSLEAEALFAPTQQKTVKIKFTIGGETNG